jgi:RsmE family RNA methyltransferase
LVVGPEGGFVPFEAELLRAQGLAAVHLGSRRLRVETAVAALVGRLCGLE